MLSAAALALRVGEGPRWRFGLVGDSGWWGGRQTASCFRYFDQMMDRVTHAVRPPPLEGAGRPRVAGSLEWSTLACASGW